jgi:hypothetical protein
VHENLPCGLYVFDDRLTIGGYNRDTDVLRVVIDSDDPDAIDWADTLYSRYRQEADEFDPGRLWPSERKNCSVGGE